MPAPNIVPPPRRLYRRARHWNTFESLFCPLALPDGSLIRDPSMLLDNPDPRYRWTVLDPMTGTLYLAAGIHVVNRLGYVYCANGWGGAWSDHPEYLY